MPENIIKLGTDENGYTVYARVRVDLKRETPSPHETIDHFLAYTCTEVSVIHETYRPGRKPAPHDGPPYENRHEPESLGASRDPFRDVITPAPGWDLDELEILADLGDRWHLNAMKAGCRHQTVVWEEGRYGQRQPSLHLTEPCPVTGYRYGTAWLCEPLPPHILDYFLALAEGTDHE